MSRSKPRSNGGGRNPIQKYISYSGGAGMLSYYDKVKKERQEMESIDLVILDVRNSITGYSETTKSMYTSNMIADTGKEVLKVITFIGGKPKTIAEGLYKDIKEKLRSVGGKFTVNVIALADVGDGEEVVNVQLSGSALQSWISFTTENPSFYDLKVTISQGVLSKRDSGETVAVSDKEVKDLDAKLAKNPRAPRPVWFFVPDIVGGELSDEEIERATEEDEKLQAYFDGVSTAPVKGTNTEKVTDAPEPSDDEDDLSDLPF